MTEDHSTRAHALLSASGAHRWMSCTASALLEAEFRDSTSEAAAEGNLAHELAEAKLLNYIDAKKYSKTMLTRRRKELMKDPLWDDEMEEYTDVYLDHIKGIAAQVEGNSLIIKAETRLDLTAYVPGGFGTADCIIIGSKEMHVVDLKYGKSPDGRVRADGNPQLMLYAIGAYSAFGFMVRPDTIHTHIVQPRLSDGITSAVMTADELLAFGEKVKEKAAEALSGEGVYDPTPQNCKYCRARKTCRARAQKNLLSVDPELKGAPLLTDEEVGKYLNAAADLEKWISDLKEYALKTCLTGGKIPGWKAVEGRGSRSWTDEAEAFDAIRKSGIPDEMLYERKPLTLAAVEKLMGKKSFGEVAGGYVQKTAGKPALVTEADKREAITNVITAAEAFK